MQVEEIMKVDRFTLALSVTLLQCFGIAILAMVAVWTGHYRGGFAWDGSGKQFNYHPVFMIVSMVFLNSQGMHISILPVNLLNSKGVFNLF